jgi:hypothetical protein
MTCVWDSLTNGLRPIQHNPISLLNCLKENNKPPIDVTIDGEKLSEKRLEENVEHIKNIQVSRDGYFCGLHDPLIVAYVQTFRVNVDNEICGHTAKFRVPDGIKLVKLRSNNAHMDCVGTQ